MLSTFIVFTVHSSDTVVAEAVAATVVVEEEDDGEEEEEEEEEEEGEEAVSYVLCTLPSRNVLNFIRLLQVNQKLNT